MKKLLLLAGLVLPTVFIFAQPRTEFRGVWIASVDNIDWPKRGQFQSDSQKKEFIRQLDMHKANGMNAVIVQVRPATDAFYPSPYEPWSQWLTGVQGKPPSPYYDPLEFTISESHKRGFEYHAWLNPYRANFSIGKASIAKNHITKLHPEWFLRYGTTLYFDPGNPEGQDWVVNVIKDIVSRYDVDAIHMDDYFYPYRIPGKEFPDEASYAKYGKGMNKEDWRRANVDTIIRKISVAIKEVKPWVRFGVSPFGVWRNKSQDPEGSDTKAGVTNYDDLYADILLWLREKWIDYVAPQIYFEFEQPRAPYQALLDWWNDHAYGRHLYIGLGIYKAGTSAPWRDKTQLPRQIDAMRKKENVQGAMYFSSTSFEKNPLGWNDSLRNNYYRLPALLPPMNWIDAVPPRKPEGVSISPVPAKSSGAYQLQAKAEAEDGVRSMAVYISSDINDVLEKKAGALKLISTARARDAFETLLAPDRYFRNGGKYYIAVSFISENNVESDISEVVTVNSPLKDTSSSN